ncbi:hypothetical protein [Planomonospora venezuelensis]|uniref:Secreted protein n=1 Tax=Planomonospora venezuelensis TaxID=1999 RepID=A0A841DFW5_PLAVE|nr:hypothetical protein [Planomonospora venezuelensis]MBB5967897.1 hypothetical protein [Planomonospora venezuelensis]GIN05532.1 hypothetical protein Pve01_71900 [Planomonospora venezuelensis]
MRKVAGGLLAAGALMAVVSAGPATADAGARVAAERVAAAGAAEGVGDGRPKPPYNLGFIRSSRKHTGYARASFWISSFGEKHFQVFGRLYDRDPHPGHCASVQARFHYDKGGTGRSPSRRYCHTSPHREEYTGYLLESKGPIHRVDVKICVADGRRGPVSHCRTETVRNEDLAW